MKSSKKFGGFIFYCYICIKNNNNYEHNFYHRTFGNAHR